jgi:thiol:disulfide interchange protein DsbG
MMAATRYGTEGDPKAPRVWMFIDPYCAFSLRAEQQLRPYAASDRLQLAIVPVSVLDYEDQGRSTPAAQVMASLPAERMIAAWTGQKLGGPPPADGAAKLQANDAAKDAIALKGTPTFLWQRGDGTVGRADGIPADLDAMIASIGH